MSKRRISIITDRTKLNYKLLQQYHKFLSRTWKEPIKNSAVSRQLTLPVIDEICLASFLFFFYLSSDVLNVLFKFIFYFFVCRFIFFLWVTKYGRLHVFFFVFVFYFFCFIPFKFSLSSYYIMYLLPYTVSFFLIFLLDLIGCC